LKRSSKSGQMAAGVPALITIFTGLSPSFGFGRFVEDARHHAAQQRKAGAAVGLRQMSQMRLLVNRGEHRLDARTDGREKGDGLGVAVGQGQPGTEHVGRLVLPDQLGDDVEHAEAVVADHDALGIARGAGV
jgi:hypothetical protein